MIDIEVRALNKNRTILQTAQLRFSHIEDGWALFAGRVSHVMERGPVKVVVKTPDLDLLAENDASYQ